MKERTQTIMKAFVFSDYPMSLKNLQSEFQISSRTIQNELKELNEFLRVNQLPLIKRIRNEGYQLIINKAEKKSLIFHLDQESKKSYLDRENRIFDLILAFALHRTPIFLYKKEREYLVSKSTLDEDMRRLRREVSQYGVEVVSVPKQGIILTGKERSIRMMLYDVINKKVGVIDSEKEEHLYSVNQRILHNYISTDLLKIIDQLYTHSISSIEMNIYRNQLILFAAIWYCRFSQNHQITSHSMERHERSSNEILAFVTLINDTFQITPSEVEMNYLLFMLSTINSNYMKHSIEWGQAQLLSIKLIQFIETKTRIPLFKKEATLHEGLFKHISGLINRLNGNVQIVNPLKETIRSSYPQIYGIICEFVKKEEWLSTHSVTDDEIAFLTIHFSTVISAINQEIHYAYKAVVICNHGVTTGKLLAERLQELFDIEIVAILSSREVDVIHKLDADLIFSTVQLADAGKPVLTVNPIIHSQDKARIFSFLQQHHRQKKIITHAKDQTQMFYALSEIIEQSGGKMNAAIYKKLEILFEEHHLMINKREIQPMLKDVLKDQHILLKESVGTWEEAIQIVARPLLADQSITNHYIEAMIDSVKTFGPYIVIGKHLALAHARPEDGVNKLDISVATFKEGIYFGNETNDPVKIIFCLAAVDSFSHLNIMKSLIELINDENKLAALCELDSVSAFKKYLLTD